MHPPGPGILYPECTHALDLFWQNLHEHDEKAVMEGMAAGIASGIPDDIDYEDGEHDITRIEASIETPPEWGAQNIEGVIETPPEWGSPDEGNPNQPRRPPEYQPPQVCYAKHTLSATLTTTLQSCKADMAPLLAAY